MNTLLILLIFLHTLLISCHGVSVLELNSLKRSDFDVMAKRACGRKIGECSELVGDEELMDSESNRRVLMMGKRYISYETLKRDLVPCGTPGSSYYNCRSSGVANPYNRGCEVITRCARDSIGS